MIKREKSFFHSATFSTNEEGKMLFFIFSLRSLCHDQEWKFFFDLATTSTTLWSREKKVFFFIYLLRSIRHVQERKKLFFIQPLCPLMKKEKWCFSFIHYDHYATTKSEFFFVIYLLRSLRYDPERKKFFFHLPTTITTPWSREKKVFSFSHYVR